jgi:hypothetical protein
MAKNLECFVAKLMLMSGGETVERNMSEGSGCWATTGARRRVVNTWRTGVAVAAGVLTLTSVASGQGCEPLPLIVNGSFELPLIPANTLLRTTPASWNWGFGAIGFIFNGNVGYPWPAPAHLVQFMDIGNTSAPLLQQFTVSARSLCHLRWKDNAAVTSFGNSPYIVRLLDSASQVVFSSAYNGGNAGVWRQRSETLLLNPGSYTLSYQANGVFGGFDTLIDDVSFVSEQTPGAVAGPELANACGQSTFSFEVSTTGQSPFTYHWHKDGNPIDPLANPSAATQVLTLTDITDSDVATYHCIVSNSCGSIPSNPVTLTICIGDFNCDGGVDGSDIEAFFAAWVEASPAADVNQDGGVDGSDVEVFFERWVSGC